MVLTGRAPSGLLRRSPSRTSAGCIGRREHPSWKQVKERCDEGEGIVGFEVKIRGCKVVSLRGLELYSTVEVIEGCRVARRLVPGVPSAKRLSPLLSRPHSLFTHDLSTSPKEIYSTYLPILYEELMCVPR